MGFVLGLLDGTVEIEGFAVGVVDGSAETLGDPDGVDVGIPVFVGIILGWLDG